MPRIPNIKAIATRDSIANLWSLAAKIGEATIRLPSRSACYNVRNKLYKHRAYLRKQAFTHVGLESCDLDAFKIQYGPENPSLGTEDQPWLLRISYEEIIEFELLIPSYLEDQIPHFDTALEHIDANVEDPEDDAF